MRRMGAPFPTYRVRRTAAMADGAALRSPGSDTKTDETRRKFPARIEEILRFEFV